jgi:hypothetical protein
MPLDEEYFRSIPQHLRQNKAFREGKLFLDSIFFFFFHSKEFKPDKFFQGEGLTEEQVAKLCDALKVNISLKSVNLTGNYFCLLISFCCCLFDCSQLSNSLFFADNEIGDVGAEKIAECLKINTSQIY